jgi:ABC-2 type transport system permease protein
MFSGPSRPAATAEGQPLTMQVILSIARRELIAYFSTPLAYVFIVAFLTAAGAAPFYFGAFIERHQADLTPFFLFHPWLFLVLIPAVGMRLWAEERRQGTIELLMTLPVTSWQAVTGKFLAGWLFIGVNLALTFPIWISVNYLGDPDNGVIAASYVASFLMAGALLAVTSCVSALTKSQVIAFVFAVVASFLLLMSGLDIVLNLFTGWAPQYLVDLVASFSLLTHFGLIARGVIDLGAIVLFLALIVLFLFINRQVVETWRT